MPIQPGSIPSVQKRSCTIVGPLMRWPVFRDSRSMIGLLSGFSVDESNDSLATFGGCVEAITLAETTSIGLLFGQ